MTPSSSVHQQGALRSQDDGRTWKTVYSHSQNPNDGTPYKALLANPLNSAEVLFSASWADPQRDKGIWRSVNVGSLFTRFDPIPVDAYASSLAFDRGSPQTLYASAANGLWSYTLPTTADSLPKSGDPLSAALPIFAVVATAILWVGMKLRRY